MSARRAARSDSGSPPRPRVARRQGARPVRSRSKTGTSRPTRIRWPSASCNLACDFGNGERVSAQIEEVLDAVRQLETPSASCHTRPRSVPISLAGRSSDGWAARFIARWGSLRRALRSILPLSVRGNQARKTNADGIMNSGNFDSSARMRRDRARPLERSRRVLRGYKVYATSRLSPSRSSRSHNHGLAHSRHSRAAASISPSSMR